LYVLLHSCLCFEDSYTAEVISCSFHHVTLPMNPMSIYQRHQIQLWEDYFLILYFDHYYTAVFSCNESSLMHCSSSVYSVTIPLQVSGLLVAHQLVNRFHSIQARRQSTKTYNTYRLSHTYIVTS
jgi:hypothetical protein